MRGPRQRRGSREAAGQSEELWAPLALLSTGAVAILVLLAALPQERAPVAPADDGHEAALLELVAKHGQLLADWHAALVDLCNDPLLQAEALAPDCESGTITLGDELFDPTANAQLSEEGMRKLHVAINSLLRSLRGQPLVWENLESIELRGHADPRARRDPYVTNMRVSRERPMTVMLYLISDWALAERDRRDLERLLLLSAASHSRPPKSCPDQSRDCDPYWRRVEITPRIKDARVLSQLHGFMGKAQELLSEGS